MELNTTINNELMNNKMITTSSVLDLGFSKTLLTNYVKEGLLERIAHGVYALPETIIDDMYLLLLRSAKVIFSHDTSLFLNHLSERTPFIHSVTIPSNAVLPEDMRKECICYYIKPELYSMGIIQRKTTFGNIVRCYNPERTICDLLRSRRRLDEETVLSGIRSYAASNEKNLNLLAEYADLLKVGKELKQYMEVLL